MLGPHYLDRLIQFGYPIYVSEFDCLGFLSVLVTVDRWPELVNILYTSYNKKLSVSHNLADERQQARTWDLSLQWARSGV